MAPKCMLAAVLAGCALANQASAFIPSLPHNPTPSKVNSLTRLAPSTYARISSTSSAFNEQRGMAPLQATTFQFDLASLLGGIQGGSKIGNRKLVVVTGTSSGLGKRCAESLVNRGDYFVVCAVRDPEKMKAVAEELGMPRDSYAILKLDLGSFDSVRKFANDLKAFKGARPIDSLVCNAAVYLPAKSVPSYTQDDIEESLQINHLGHFLLVSLLMDEVKKSKDPRITIVGSITGNTNSIGGGFVWPRADLGDLRGMANGSKKPISMIDGKTFNGAKAYKDSKVCNMMTMLELHRRYHDSTGITFNSMYPGCIAETALFREKRQWFRTIFPLFMKYVTGGYVSEEEAGERLAQCVYDPVCRDSGNYWSWNGNAKQVGVYDFKTGTVVGAGGAGGDIFKNEVSPEVNNPVKAGKMWDLSSEITGAVWPEPAAATTKSTGRSLQMA